MKFKKYAVLAGVNEPKKSCHGVRKTRAEVAACADCTESQMMAMFGWTDPKMPAHYIAQANREKLGISGMDKIVAFDQSQNTDDFLPLPGANKVRQIERSGRRRQSGHTSATRAGRQMPPHTRKRLRLLQLRQQIADKRQNHTALSLAARENRLAHG